jgi:hypothetical protein
MQLLTFKLDNQCQTLLKCMPTEVVVSWRVHYCMHQLKVPSPTDAEIKHANADRVINTEPLLAWLDRSLTSTSMLCLQLHV